MNEVQGPEATRDRVRAELPEAVDVAVIGSGLGGLSAAVQLAQAGRRVAVLEGHFVAGGCATMFQRASPYGTFRFDIGLHYVGDCGPGGAVPRALSACGVEVDWIPLDPDGFDTVELPGLTFPIPANRELYRERLVERFPAERRGIDRYVRLLAEVDHMAAFLDDRAGGKVSPVAMAWTVLAHGRMLPGLQKATVGDFLDTCTRDPWLRAVLLGQSGDYGVAPRRASLLLHAGLANHYFKGGWYPRGGGQALADALVRRLEALGGSVHLRHPVRQIRLDAGGRVEGVEVAPFQRPTRVLRAPVVISNADLVQTATTLLPPGAGDPAWAQRAAGMEMASAIFLTCLGLRGPPPPIGARNLWIFDDPDIDGMYEEIQSGQLRARCAYITSGTAKDPGGPGHAPEGMHTIEVMTLAPGAASAWTERPPAGVGYRREGDYLERKTRMEEALVERLDQRFPGLAGQIVLRESASPLTHTRYTQATLGTGYGAAATPAQFMKGRPGPKTPIPGLFLAGASTRSGHGIIGALRSGGAAAGAVQKAG